MDQSKTQDVRGLSLWAAVLLIVLFLSPFVALAEEAPAAPAAPQQVAAPAAPQAPAQQQDGGQQGGGLLRMGGFFAIVLVIMYLLMIRPQQKKDRERRELLESVRVNDQIITVGGIHGTVTAVKDKELIVRVDEKTKLRLSRSALSTIVREDSNQENES